jgi:hypothetical protein
MPNDWNPETYRRRARQWQDKAIAIPSGDERQACEALAEGYARLAQLIEKAQASDRITPIDDRRVSELQSMQKSCLQNRWKPA